LTVSKTSESLGEIMSDQSATTTSEVDPVTFEVVKHRLWQINDEQGTTIRQISSSPIVTEANDFNVGIFTGDGELVSAGPYVLLHLTTMDDMISAIRERAASIKKGDVFLCNDPSLGALHQSDVAVVTPVFKDDEIVAWFSNTLHQLDVGGVDRGSFCINARDTFDEPPRYFLKIVNEGEWSSEAEHTYLQSSRMPGSLELNLRAQTAALNVAKDRFHDLCEEYDTQTVTAVMERSVDYAEEELRTFIAELPDGEWSATGYMDGDGHTEDIHEVHLTIRKENEQLHFDYAGTDPEAIGGLNATIEACYAASTAPIYAFICDGEIDWNAAVKRVVSVAAPTDSVVNASATAGVSIASIGFTWLVSQVATKALSELLLDSDHEDRACPSWLASWNGPNVFGTTEDGEPFGTMLSDAKGGGAAGRSFGDGFEHAGSLFAPRSKLSNVEDYERKFPLRYLCRGQLPDSAGAGEYRGGTSIISVLTPHRASDVEVINSTFGSDQSPAFGIAGGYPGGGAQTSVADADEATALMDDIEAFHDLSSVTHHASKSTIQLEDDDALICYAAGGGGFGDPLDREPESIERDVRTGRLSRELAEELYGAVFTEVKGEISVAQSGDAVAIDNEATKQKRDTRRDQRLENGSNRQETDEPCPSCGETAVIESTRELGNISPWIAVRHGGESPNFHAIETICDGCGVLLDVTQVRT
jgi:N-methylhydantoinase B